MKTIIELITSIIISSIANFLLVVYEMIYGQGWLIYRFSQYYILSHAVFVLLCGLFIFFVFEKKFNNRILYLLVTSLILFIIMVIFLLRFPYYETDQYIFDWLNKGVAWLWMRINKNIDIDIINNGLSSMFVKYIFLDDLKIIVPFMIVITAKIFSIIQCIVKSLFKH